MAYRALLFISALSLPTVFSMASVAQDEPSEEITEARQESEILTTLSLSQNLDTKDLEVSVSEGIATLTGKVSEAIKKELAEQIALGVDGIEEVNNRIEIDPDYRPPTTSESTSRTEVVDDESITAAVKSKLLWSKNAKELSVEVETTSGKVTLVGTAKTHEAKEMAGTLASNTKGVESVDNKLSVVNDEDTKTEKTRKEPAGLSQRISDAWITAKVKSSLRYSSHVNAADISVSTKDGVVTLSGTVPSKEERTMAVELTESVRGVKGVDSEAFNHQ